MNIDINTASRYFYAPTQNLPRSRNMPYTSLERYLECAMDPRQGPSITRMQGTIPFLGNFGGQIIPLRTALRRRREMGRPRPFSPQATTRSAMVDKGTHTIQRHAHSQTRRDRVPTHGQLRLWMGRGTERVPRGSRILEQRRRTLSHYMERVEGRPLRSREFPTAIGRPQRPPARGQLGSLSHSDRSDLAITCHDGRAATIVVLTRHEQLNIKARYIISPANVWADKLSRNLDSDDWRLPFTICGTRHAVGLALDRPFRFGTQHPTTPLQRGMEGPNVRSGGRTPPPRRKPGAEETTCATLHGPYHPTSSKNYEKAAHRLQ
jgi:hypothetical protein